MRYLDHSEASIRSHISMLNSAMCDGDRSDADIDRITQSAMKWEAGAPEADGYERLFKDEPTGNTYFKAKHGDHWRIFQQRGKGYTVLCGLVDSVHKLATVDGTQRGRLVCWTDEHGKPCEAVMPILNLLSWNAAGVDALANRGLYIYPGQLKAVAEMLALFPSSGQVYAANKPGWLMLPDDSIAYVLPGASYGVEGVRLDVAEHYYRAKGTLADWREQIGAKCVGNTRLTLAVSAAFAGPLLHGLGLAGIGLHFISPTSRGKTSLLMAAGSVIGGGNGVMGYVRAWNGTVNSQEVFAASASDSTLIFDELGGANAKEIMKAVYSLINGIGRSRMDKNSEVRPVRVWRIVLMSAGELDAHEFAKTADVQTKGGIDVRLLAVPMPANAHGMFEDLHGASGGKEFADSLKANALAYHGTAFREFVSKLVPSDIPPQAQLVPTSPSMFGLYHHLQSVHQTIKDFETCAGTNASRSRPCVPFVRRHRGGRRTRDRVRHHWLA